MRSRPLLKLRVFMAEYRVDRSIGDALRHARFCADCSLVAVCEVFEALSASLDAAYDNLAKVTK